MEYQTFNITIGSVVSLCWQNLTLRVIMDILWSIFRILHAITVAVERFFWVLIYLMFAYIDRVIAYTLNVVIGYNTTAILLNTTTTT